MRNLRTRVTPDCFKGTVIETAVVKTAVVGAAVVGAAVVGATLEGDRSGKAQA